jgi:hypothetical protein
MKPRVTALGIIRPYRNLTETSENDLDLRLCCPRHRNAIVPMKTFSAKPQDIERDWFVVDATDKVLGRLASQIALRLRGKHKVIFTPHVDYRRLHRRHQRRKIRVTGNKAETSSTTATAATRAAFDHQLFEDAGALSRAARWRSRQGHAAQGSARLQDAEEAQVLCRRRRIRIRRSSPRH